jgi:hypothetical protein
VLTNVQFALEGNEEVTYMALAQRKFEEKTEMREMKEMWRKLATPGTPHKMLERRVGRWSAKTRNWVTPHEPPVESTGSCERKMILGGRFLREDYKGEMFGTPFTGIGVTGYDNHLKKYVMSWMDSMSTGLHTFEGTASPDGKTIIMDGRFENPMKGPGTWHGVTRLVDDNTEVFEMHATYDRGGEERFEITYTREK